MTWRWQCRKCSDLHWSHMNECVTGPWSCADTCTRRLAHSVTSSVRAGARCARRILRTPPDAARTRTVTSPAAPVHGSFAALSAPARQCRSRFSSGHHSPGELALRVLRGPVSGFCSLWHCWSHRASRSWAFGFARHGRCFALCALGRSLSAATAITADGPDSWGGGWMQPGACVLQAAPTSNMWGRRGTVPVFTARKGARGCALAPLEAWPHGVRGLE